MWLLPFLSFATAAPIDRIAAVVNSEVITISEVYDAGTQFIINEVLDVKKRRAAELMVLDSLITQKLITQELQRIGMDVTSEELERSISDIASSNKLSVEQLQNEILKSGMGWEQYQDQLRGSIQQMKFKQLVLQPRISILEDALLDRYQRSTASAPTKTRLAIVFCSTPAGMSVEDQKSTCQEKSETVKSRLEKGEDILKISKELDESAFGGDMGLLAENSLREDLNAYAFNTPLGELSTPACDTTGCFFFYPVAKEKGDVPSFEELRPKLLEAYYAERFDREQKKWAEQAKRRATIQILLQEL